MIKTVIAVGAVILLIWRSRRHRMDNSRVPEYRRPSYFNPDVWGSEFD